jgi:hypothetical protein
MDGGQLTAIIIVALIIIGSVVRASVRGPRHPVIFNDSETKAENRRLREELQELRQRINVLERIAVEKENSLAKEIESLRDR